MKRFSLIIVLLLALAFVAARAQQIEPITAQDPYEEVVEWVKQNHFDDPQFVAYGALAGELPGVPVAMSIEYTGKATAWGYFFISESDPYVLHVCGVMKMPGLGYQIFTIDPEILPEDLYISGTPINLMMCIDSDEAFTAMAEDAEYQALIELTSEKSVNLVGMTINDIHPFLNQGEAYYSIESTTDLGEIIVFVHATEKDVHVVSDFTSVEGGNYTQISICPNPASEYLHINTGFAADTRMRIFGQTGCEVLAKRFAGETSVSISGLAPGVYYVEILSQGRIIRERFIKY